MTPSQASATSSSGIQTPSFWASIGLVDSPPPTQRSKPGPCSGCVVPTKDTSLTSGATSWLGWPLIDGLELARQVGVLGVADVAALDLLERRGAVDDLVGGDAGDRGAEERRGASRRRPPGCPGRRPRAAAQIAGTSSMRIQWYCTFCRSVMSAVPRAYVVLISPIARSCSVRAAAAVDADPHHEVLVVELLGLQRAGLAAVEPRLALGVEAPPAEPAAQVAAVDGGEAALARRCSRCAPAR